MNGWPKLGNKKGGQNDRDLVQRGAASAHLALCTRGFPDYITCMAKAHLVKTETTVRDSKSGRMLTLRGAGALKGQLKLKKSVDLTKPIASQAMKGSRTGKAADALSKR